MTIKKHILEIKNNIVLKPYDHFLLDLYNPNAKSGSVYLIQLIGTDCFKIGSSKNPEARLKQIQSKCPIPLKIIYQWYGDDYRYFEKLLHDTFRANRIKGEWFKLSHENLMWITDYYPRQYRLHQSDYGKN